MDSVFSLLAKPIQEAVRERGFSNPTEPQKKAIPLILEGKNVLLIAPTATGKTEAAILPILSMFISSPERNQPGIKIVYITPLRALNRDLMERLEWWCKKLDVGVAVRHGDTAISERSKQARRPPDMLITTPETLQAILPGKIMRKHLRSVRWIVVDEVHEFACDKRGSQLSLGLERLRWVAGRDFQVVGLSATIGSPEKVARFLVGANRPCEIVKISISKDVKLEVVYAQPKKIDYVISTRLYTHPEVAARLRIMRELIEKHNSVLLFTNTRSVAEVLASRFKVWDVDFPVSIHHGSLSKPSRIWAERSLKDGQLKGLVCTSSLELGIDVGRIDLVIQYNSPRQVTRLVQRVGRSGHRVGRIPKGVIITMDSDDTLEAMVIARKALNDELEPVLIPEKPYDALTHQVAGLLTQKRRWYYDEVLSMFREAYPYRNLTKEDLEKVLEYMHKRYPRIAWVSFEDQVFLRPQKLKHLYEYYFENLSMIPDEKQYLVIDQTTDTPVGILDEAFVAEYGEPGIKFIVRGSPWKIIDVYGDKIYVKPVDDPTGAIPSWVGEEIPVPFEVALEVGWIRRFVEEELKKGENENRIVEKLVKRYPASKATVREAIKEVVEQVEKGLPVPSDKVVTVEEWENYIILQCCFGSLVNRTLARILGHVFSEEYGETVGVQEDPYRIVIQREGSINAESLIRTILSLSEKNVREIVVEAVVKTGLFKRRLVHVARKFGALAKWADFSEFTLKQLVKSFEGTVIFEEALRDTLETDMDVGNVEKVLRMIRDGEIKILAIRRRKETSPIARIGVERISRKTDLIPPEKMRSILIESAKARLLNEVGVFVCLRCWNFVKPIRIKNLPEKIRCPECGSKMVGLSKESEDKILKLAEKKGRNLKGRELDLYENLLETAELISKYGYAAAVALVGHGLKPRDVEDILAEHPYLDDEFYERIIEAERKALKRRFW
ncbi:MAG: ATP-dependent helicase [Candidatus Hecatellales archaeon]|nr:MAG: ATP-dependent helicase [Candidatus Hecatellales archaeon]